MADVKQQARDKSRELFRQGIVEAAQRVFIDKGFAGARMADIATEAGLATGTLYNYFRSKEAIFAAMMTVIGEEFLGEMTAQLDELTSPLQRIFGCVEIGARFTIDNHAIYRVFHELGPESNHPPEIAERHQQLEGRYRQMLHDTVRQAQAAGEVRDDLEPEALMMVIAMALNGVLDAIFAAGATVDREAVLDVFNKVLSKGIEP